MAVSFINAASAATTSVALPAFNVGDLIVIFAYRSALTAPTLPAGYTSAFTQSANGNSMRLGWKFAVSGDTSGTWTNATLVQALIYRGVGRVGGASSTTAAASTTATAPGIATLTNATGTSWALSVYGSLQATSESTPAGLTLRSTQTATGAMGIVADSNAGTATWGSHASTLGASAASATGSLELIPIQGQFVEPGGDADFGIALWPTTSATGTIPATATDFVHGAHVKSIQYFKNGTSSVQGTGFASQVGGRISFWLYLNALPGATATLATVNLTAGGAPVFRLRITSAGILQLFEQTAQIGTNGSTLATGAWNHIELDWSIVSTTVNQFIEFLNGTSDISVSNATITNVAAADVIVGNSTGDTTLDMRTSDHYIDNSPSLASFGNLWVTAKRPFSNGTTNGFTTQIGVGGSGYGTGHAPQVNERPLSTTNGWSMVGVGSAITEEYTIEGASVGDFDISAGTQVDYMGWLFASSALSETGQIVLAGTSNSIALTSSNTTFRKVISTTATSPTAYPAGGTDIGAITSTTVTTVSLFEGGVVFAYIPAVVGAAVAAPMRSMMGMGT